jgi:hypothetical protein
MFAAFVITGFLPGWEDNMWKVKFLNFLLGCHLNLAFFAHSMSFQVWYQCVYDCKSQFRLTVFSIDTVIPDYSHRTYLNKG